MAIEAIIANMDIMWTSTDRDGTPVAKYEQGVALKHFLQDVRDEGYPLLLVSELNAASLNDAINETLGEDGVTYFSSILSSSASGSRYAVALHTLETPAHRVVAVGTDRHELEDARSLGITQCIPLIDALRGGATRFGRAFSSE